MGSIARFNGQNSRHLTKMRLPRLSITLWLWFALLVLVGICGVVTTKYVLLKIRVALADGQVTVLQEVTTLATQATDPATLSGLLEYAVKYFPSGSKQVSGSHLDRIVETARSNAIATIIARLRDVTGKDYGNDPAIWIEHYPPPRP